MQSHASLIQNNQDKIFAIIGMGLTGNSLFCQLVDKLVSENAKAGFHIKLFEKNAHLFATGLPYQINCPTIWTLNNPARNMKLTPNGENVEQWMQKNKSKWQDQFLEIDKDYVPRGLVGLYLRDQYELYKKKANDHGIIVEEYFEEIVDISPIDNGDWELKRADYHTYQVSTLFLCLGHAPSDHFSHLKLHPNYFHSSAGIEQLKQIPNGSPVYILGGQATFVDIALWLAYVKHHTGMIYTVTRNTPIITSKGNKDECDKKAVEDLKANLSQYLPNSLSFSCGKLLFWDAYKKSVKQPINLDQPPTTKQALTYQLAKYNQQPFSSAIGNIDELRSFVFTFYFSGCYQEFWSKLKEEERNEFNNHFYSLFFAYLTGITPLNARLLLELYNHSQIQEKSGLEKVLYDSQHNKFVLYFKKNNTDEVTYLIDATGLGYDISKFSFDFPLLKNLVKKGYLVPKKSGGIVINAYGQSINKEGHLQENLICIGPTASYNYHYPTSYASFIAIEAVERALGAVNLSVLQETNRRSMTLY